LLLRFDGFDAQRLAAAARMLNVTNRLGFLVALAREAAREDTRYAPRRRELAALEAALEPHRLVREETMGRQPRSGRLRAWMRTHRSQAAAHWNVMNDLGAEHLSFVAKG
jgi:hypothetical protein